MDHLLGVILVIDELHRYSLRLCTGLKPPC